MRADARAMPGVAAYGVSKAALVHLVRTLDVELRGQGIRMHVVYPQIIATAKNGALFPPEALAGAVKPDAIAQVIAFLGSDARAGQWGDRHRVRWLTNVRG